MANLSEHTSIVANPPRDAIIFLPGLGRQWNDQSLELIACKIATALDRRYGCLRFTSEGRYDTIDGKKAKICAISVQQDKQDKPKPVIDVYDFEYHTTLTQSFENRTTLGKSVMMFIAIFTNLPRVLSALFNVRRKSKTAMDKLQALYAICVFLMLSAYMMLLLIAAVGSASQLVHSTAGSAPEPWLLTTLANIGAHIAPFVVILTVGIVSMREKVLQFIVSAATDYVCLLNYMDFGERQNVITGQLETFLDKLAEQADAPYRKYHIFAYSFGSIVALDTLFTLGVEIGEQTRHIDTLVTIGSPFDLIRTYWPDYFCDRIAVPGVPRRWINLYSPQDLLGSNFRNDPKHEEAEPHIYCPNAQPTQADGLGGPRIEPKPSAHDNIPYEEVMQAKRWSLFGLLTLQGLKAHSLYWEPDRAEERNCFSYILPRMYDVDFKSVITDSVMRIQEAPMST
jgi:pimeloyl-ACP methyl ester carboxylesterase